MVFTHEHVMILGEPHHLAGLGLDMSSVMQLVGMKSLEFEDKGKVFELIGLTERHFGVGFKGQQPPPVPSVLIVKNYPGLRQFIPLP